MTILLSFLSYDTVLKNHYKNLIFTTLRAKRLTFIYNFRARIQHENFATEYNFWRENSNSKITSSTLCLKITKNVSFEWMIFFQLSKVIFPKFEFSRQNSRWEFGFILLIFGAKIQTLEKLPIRKKIIFIQMRHFW